MLAHLITVAEEAHQTQDPEAISMLEQAKSLSKDTPVLGITGTGGAGKSSLTDELIRRFLHELPDKKIVDSID